MPLPPVHRAVDRSPVPRVVVKDQDAAGLAPHVDWSPEMCGRGHDASTVLHAKGGVRHQPRAKILHCLLLPGLLEELVLSHRLQRCSAAAPCQ